MPPAATENPHLENRPPPRKTAPGDFFANPNRCTYKIRPGALETCQVQQPTPTAIASGVFYYGLRYYSPSTGRWLSRDPVGEAGGSNLYGFIGNDGVNRWDALGLVSFGLLGPQLGSDDKISALYAALAIDGLGDDALLSRTSVIMKVEHCDTGELWTESDIRNPRRPARPEAGDAVPSVLYSLITASDERWTLEDGSQRPMSVLLNVYPSIQGGTPDDSWLDDLTGGIHCTKGRFTIKFDYRVVGVPNSDGFNSTVERPWKGPSLASYLWANEQNHNLWTYSLPAAWEAAAIDRESFNLWQSFTPSALLAWGGAAKERGSLTLKIAWNCKGQIAASIKPGVMMWGLSREGRREGATINVVPEAMLDALYPDIRPGK